MAEGIGAVVGVLVVLAAFAGWMILRARTGTRAVEQRHADFKERRIHDCAATIDAFLDAVSPPIADADEFTQRGQAVEALVLQSDAALREAGINPSSLPFEPDTPAAVRDMVLRALDAEKEARRVNADPTLSGATLPTGSGPPFYAAQALRLVMEKPRRELFAKPDFYSGARWGKAVSANGKLEDYLAAMEALDPTGALGRQFMTLLQVLAATGTRSPTTPDEEASYEALVSQ